MKKLFSRPEVSVVRVTTTDIICTSGGGINPSIICTVSGGGSSETTVDSL